MEHVTGKIVKAGKIDVDGKTLTGFFVECSGADIMEVSRLGMYNAKVAVILDRRSNPRDTKLIFQRPAVERIGVRHANQG